jgi:TRAP-type C4-dicarboxylate transport system substrate-binding protein
MRRVLFCLLFALLPLPCAMLPASAQTTVIKLATLAPDGSVWHKTLLDMGDEWNKGTQGRVQLKVYPGGIAGDDPDMVRKMRIGQVQASALTVKGLSDISDEFEVFTLPLLFDSYDELYHVLDALEPHYRKTLESKGFVMLFWGHAGWVYFFTKQPVTSAADLKKQKIWVWSGDDKGSSIWKEIGFQTVPLAATDILTGLQTGMIDALPTFPLGALQLQWFRTTNHMVDSGLAPMVGAIVMTRQAWNKISDADHVVMMQACRKAEARLKEVVPRQEKDAIVQMQARGLQVTHVRPEALAEWRALTEKFAAKMRGTIVPPEILDLTLRERDAYRKQNAK